MARIEFKPARLALGCLILCCTTLLPNRTAWGNDFTADIATRMLNDDVTGRLYVTDGRYRMDLNVKEKGVSKGPVVIVDRSKGVTLLLNPNTHTYDTFENFSFRAHMIDPFQAITYLQKNATKRRVGTDTVAGYATDHCGFYDRDVKLADVWFAGGLGDFPVKAHIISGRNDGAVKAKTNISDVTLALSNIAETPIDATVFAIPKGFAKQERPTPAKKEPPAITQTVKGAAPWGRRIGKRGEIQVAVDPQRPIKLVLKNMTDRSMCTYRIIPQGSDPNAAKPKQVILEKRGQVRRIEIEKSKKSAWVYVQVDEGLVYAGVTNEADPFAFNRDRQIKEGYLQQSILGSTGIIVDPARPMTIIVSGDSQDASASSVTLKCFKRDYKDIVFNQTRLIANGATETWEFSPDQQIRTCEIGVTGENDGVKYRTEQPAVATKGATKAAATPAKPRQAPNIVHTQPGASVGSGPKTTARQRGAGLDKDATREIMTALNSGDTATVKSHLDKGMDPDVFIYGAPLLQKAANLSSPEMVKLIIASGADLQYKDRSGNDALFQAQSNFKHWQEVIPVLVEAGIGVNRNTPIWKVAFKTKEGKFQPGVQETLAYLLSKGANVNTPISKSGNTLLMFAAKMAWLEPFEFYLAQGADIHASDAKGNTALSWAKTERRGEQPYEQQNRKAIIALLASKGVR